MPELELELRELAREVAFPPEPDVSAAVLARLRPRPRRRRALVLALGVALLALAVALAVPPARSALLEWLRIGGVRVERVETLPPLEERLPLDLGERVSLQEARSRVEWPLALPGEPRGGPDGVFLRTPPPGGAVAMTYRSKDGSLLLVFTQFRGDALGLAQKSLGPDTTLRRVAVGPHAGVWIEGAPHAFVYQDTDGVIREEPRLAGNVLLWEREGVTLRLEGRLDLETALRLARSVS